MRRPGGPSDQLEKRGLRAWLPSELFALTTVFLLLATAVPQTQGQSTANAIVNPGFENTGEAWQEFGIYGGGVATIYDASKPRTGSQSAKLYAPLERQSGAPCSEGTDAVRASTGQIISPAVTVARLVNSNESFSLWWYILPAEGGSVYSVHAGIILENGYTLEYFYGISDLANSTSAVNYNLGPIRVMGQWFQTQRNLYADLQPLKNEPAVYDANDDGNYDAGETVIFGNPGVTPRVNQPLLRDSKIKFVDLNGDKVWNIGESIVYDTNDDGQYDAGEPSIFMSGPGAGAALTNDPKIRFEDVNRNGHWNTIMEARVLYVWFGAFGNCTTHGETAWVDNATLLFLRTLVPPVAHFTASVSLGTAPLAVEFDASDSFARSWGASLVSYSWASDDGAQGSDVRWTHTFTSPGNHSVTLAVRDSDGQSASQTQVISVAASSSTTFSTPLLYLLSGGLVLSIVFFLGLFNRRVRGPSPRSRARRSHGH